MDPTAQGQDGQQVQQDGQQAPQPQTIPLERFQEVISQRNDDRAQLAQLQAQLAEMRGAFSVMSQQRQEQPQDPFAGMDDESRAYAQRVTAPVMQQLQATQQQLQAFQMAQQLQQQVQMAAQQYGIDPAIAYRAQQLVQGWAQNPATLHLAKPEDAIRFALGEQQMAAQASQRQAGAGAQQLAQLAAQQRQQFNGGYQLPNTPAAPPAVGVPGAKKPLPANFDELPYETQVALSEAALGDDTF